MNLGIYDEFSPLKAVVVCFGSEVPDFESYSSDDPEFTKYHGSPWDKDLFLKQQDAFFSILEKYNVKLIFPETKPKLIWQAYTRDTGFVLGDKFYYSTTRNLGDRNGEDIVLLEALQLDDDQIVVIDAPIEGGDVVANKDEVFVGIGSRTSQEAIDIIQENYPVKVFRMGENVMHLDTRLTLLPKNIALSCTDDFEEADTEFVQKNFELIPVTKAEAQRLGTNVFIINPETVVVPTEHARIADALKKKGLNIELIDYTEPISLGGSFRCTTLPLSRG